MILSRFLQLVVCGAVCAPAFSAFPTVPPGVQHERDRLRRDILNTELATEQTALAAARTADDKHRHAQNVEALQRELAPLNGTAPLRMIARVAATSAPAPAAAEAPAPFWDTFRRGATPSPVLPSTGKELP